jgi:serine/threonine-protein kinase
MTYQQSQTARALRRAETETEKARDVTRFLVEMFRDADPYQGGTANTSAAPPDAATERIERELAGQPEVRGELLHQLAVIQRNLGRYDKAEQLLRRAIDDRRAVLAPNDTTDRRLLSAQSELSLLLQKKGDLQAAESLQREVLAGRRRLHGEYHRDVAGSMRNLSGIARQRGDLAEAEALARRSMEIYRRVTGAETDVAPLVQDLAVLRHERGDDREAVTLARQVVGFGSQEMWMWDPQSASDLLELASVLAKNGDCDGARTLSERSTMIHARISPPGRASARPEKALAACDMPR